MHEWALAEGVILTALKAAEKEGIGRIAKVVVAIGELQQIEAEVFDAALKAVRPEGDLRLTSAEFVLRREPARFRCRACGRAFAMSEAAEGLDEEAAEAVHMVPELAHTYLCCPGCGGPDFEVLCGRGVWIASIEGGE